MDDLHPVAISDHATWQSDAEKQSGRQPPSRRRLLGFGLAALVAVALIVAGVIYWLDARHFESTDDAFVDGYVTQMASQVAGRVTQLLVTDNQHVEAGQALLSIDPRDYQVKLTQAKAQQVNARAVLQQANAQVAVQQASVDQAQANVRVATAELEQAQQDYNRYQAIDPHAVSRQQVDSATATFRSAQAKLDAAKQAASGAAAQVQAASAQVAAAQAQVLLADANVAAAELQLSYCDVVAPVGGRIAHRNVAVGNYVNPGQALFAVVQDDHWITANFKETQLRAMHPGEPVDIRVDAIPKVSFHGRVDSLQPGTGSLFSVLPAENATGNYVKIVQRLPVKIVFDDDRVKDYALAPGMSVVPYVKVR